MSNSNMASNPNAVVPLGLFSLGISIFLLSGNAWGALSDGSYTSFGLITGGLGMLIAGYWELRVGNVFGGVSFSLLGTFFGSSAIYHWFFASSAKDPTVSLAWISFTWLVVVGLLAILSYRANITLPGAILWTLLFLFFAFRWISGAFHVDIAMKIAAVDGIIVALMAWTGGFVVLRTALE
jgi:succinate-acetate transporter protein